MSIKVIISTEDTKEMQESIISIEDTKEMQKRIDDLTEQLKEQKEQAERIETTVYQLLGGLFNQGSQRNVLRSHISYLIPSALNDFDVEKISEEGIWPTTRQGDELEAKFAKQRKKYKKLKKRLKKLQNNTHDSTTTHDMMWDDETGSTGIV